MPTSAVFRLCNESSKPAWNWTPSLRRNRRGSRTRPSRPALEPPIVTLPERGRLLGLRLPDVGAVTGWADQNLVEADMLGARRDIEDEVTQILRLQHTGAILFAYRDGPVRQNGGCNFARANHRCAKAVHTY